MKKKILFLVLFIGLGLIALSIPFTNIIGGSMAKFSLFDFFAPASGMFIGSLWGALAVTVVKVASWLMNGGGEIDMFTIARFITLAGAAFYFGSKKKYPAFIALACMIAFWAHPVGRQAWVYALYWLIPIVATFKKDSLALNSLGATFTAHCIGSIGFLYVIPTTPELWISLIPIVFMERALMAGGIWVSYPVFNTILDRLTKFSFFKHAKTLVNKNYVISKNFFQNYV